MSNPFAEDEHSYLKAIAEMEVAIKDLNDNPSADMFFDATRKARLIAKCHKHLEYLDYKNGEH